MKKKPSILATVLAISISMALTQIAPAFPALAQQPANQPAAAQGSGVKIPEVKSPVNPFSDVPAGGWPYRALSGLAGAGLLDDYRPDSFGPGRVMTRYEVALIAARAKAKAKALPAGKKLPRGIQETLDRLEMEFKDEMAMLQVRNNVLESKSRPSDPAGILDRLQVTGVQARQLDLTEQQAGAGTDPASGRLSYEMSRVAQVGSELKLNNRLELGGRLASVQGKEEDQRAPEQLRLALNGRLWLAPQLSISSEYAINGIGMGETRVARDLAAAVSLIPDLLNVQARYRLEDLDNISSRGATGKSTTTVALDGEMALNKQTTLRAGYEIASTLGAGSEVVDKRTTTKFGLGYRLGENASLQAVYQLIDFGDGEGGATSHDGATSGNNKAGEASPRNSNRSRLENAISAELSIKF